MTNGHLPLKYRGMKACDIERVAELSSGIDDEGIEPELIRQLWPVLLRAGSLKCAVIEDADRRIVALGASVFVTDTFVHELQSGPEPFVAARLMQAALSASSPICTPIDIAAANAGAGLNVFIIHSGHAEASNAVYPVSDIKTQLMRGFLDLHAGYNIQRILVEARGEEERCMYVQGSSFRLITDYAERTTTYQLLRRP